jgi:hypothetical protein
LHRNVHVTPMMVGRMLRVKRAAKPLAFCLRNRK